MKRILIILIVIIAMTATSVSAQRQDSLFVTTALKEARHLPRTICFPLYFARLFLDCPYVAHTLEINDEEQLVTNTRQLDCTTLVENVTALTLCVYRNLYTWRDFCHVLQKMRYRGGLIKDYTSRLHYFSDWINDNTAKGLVTEIQQPNPPFTAVQTLDVHFMSFHPHLYKALNANPSMVPVIRAQEDSLTGRQYKFIPKTAVVNSKALRRAVCDGDIIAITCSKPGLDIAHLGFAVWRSDGLHLLNASQLHKRVVEEPMPLARYLQKHPSHTGIRIIRIQH